MKKIPRAGEPTMVTKPIFGKYLYTQSFFYEDGREEEYTLWGYSKKTASVIFPVTTDRKVLAIRQFRQGSNSFILEIPGGNPEGEEFPKVVAGRELLEETGYQPTKVIRLGPEYWFEPGNLNAKFIPFLGVGCRKIQEPRLDKNEVMEFILVPLEEWYAMIWGGKVLDAKTVVISLLAMPYLGIKPQF